MSLDWFWAAVGPAAGLGLAGSWFAETLLEPRPLPPWARPWSALAVHAGVWLALYALVLTVVGRPWLAVALALAVVMAVVVVNNAKFRSLREPFVVQDFEYFADAVRHPRLYLPFLKINVWVFSLCALVIAGLVLAIRLEPWMFAGQGVAQSAVGLFGLMGSAALLVASARRAALPVTLDVEHDLVQLGLLGFLWRYAAELRREVRVTTPFAEPPLSLPADSLAHLVVVQSESFFDPRTLWAGIRTDVLETFDATCREALAHGPLRVPAWGANTIRTEFAFLFGLTPAHQGVHQFQPYRRLALQGLPQLVSWLKQAGYRTVAVHPYAASFYQRARVFKALGFDDFIAEEAFRGGARAGPYVSDMAVAEKIYELLGGDDPRPLFVFAITMENHGPLHLESATSADEAAAFDDAPPATCTELSIYLRHLRNADRMLAALRAALEGSARPGCLCWYGDHVPIMPDVYAALGKPAGETLYCLWHSERPSKAPVPQGLAVEHLALLLCAELGLRPPFSGNEGTKEGQNQTF